MKLLRQVPPTAALVHGTSLEAIEHLLLNGELPRAKNDWYFFEFMGAKSPIFKHYPSDSISSKESIEDIFSLRQFYAIENARQHFLQNELQFLPWWINEAVLDTREDWENWLNEDEPNLNRNNARNLSKRIIERKGVLILPSKTFLSKYNSEYAPPHDGIRFKCTFPVIREDIDVIIPQGEVERKKLEKYFKLAFERNLRLSSRG